MPPKLFAVIGDSLASHILAIRLERSGHKVILVHSGDGEWAPLLKAPMIPFYPAADSLKVAIEELALFCNSSISITNEELPPLTYSEGELKPFIGFGESKNSATQVLSKYNVSQRMHLSPDVASVLTSALQNLKAKKITFSELSELKFEGERVEKLVVHGGQEVIADHYIYMNSPVELLTLVPTELIGSRVRSRISKTPIFAEITVQLDHKTPLFESSNLIFLTPTNEQSEPMVGQCMGTKSVWQTFILNEYADDPEYVSNVIKSIRRQVKRAFSPSEDPAPTNLTVNSGAVADFSWLNEQKELALIASNLTMTTPLSSPFVSLAQYIDIADSAAARLPLINVDLAGRPVLDLPQ